MSAMSPSILSRRLLFSLRFSRCLTRSVIRFRSSWLAVRTRFCLDGGGESADMVVSLGLVLSGYLAMLGQEGDEAGTEMLLSSGAFALDAGWLKRQCEYAGWHNLGHPLKNTTK